MKPKLSPYRAKRVPMLLCGGPFDGGTIYVCAGVKQTLTFSLKGERGHYENGIWRPA